MADLSVSEHPDWQELRALTASWLVQRSRGKAPSPLGEEDFRTIVGIVQDPLSGSGIPDADETSSPPLSDDPYHYAREHLARCL
ncbi:hypothetical protein GMO_15750 [Gluconobacter morbifer G707]|uniref:Uncharacterized protein n=1 Tax=Gluconobacter morbifer G707 TaxID=1088869 RepID=G6XJA9_9PROT|nr:hypothetical protein GMO_15750 [Gluconobacter morbifer G707]